MINMDKSLSDGIPAVSGRWGCGFSLFVAKRKTIKLFPVEGARANPIDEYYRQYSLLYEGETDRPLVQKLRDFQLFRPPRHFIFDRQLTESPLMGPVLLHLAGLSGRLKHFNEVADRVMRNAYEDEGAFHYTLLLRGIFEKSTMWLEMAADSSRRKGSRVGYALARIFHHLIDPQETVEPDETGILKEHPGYRNLHSAFSSMQEALELFYIIEDVEEKASPYGALAKSGILDVIRDVSTPQRATLWYAFMIGGIDTVWASFSEKNRSLYIGIERLRKNSYYMDALLLFVLSSAVDDLPSEAKEYLKNKGEQVHYIISYLKSMVRKQENWFAEGKLDLIGEEFPFIPEALHFTNLPILHFLRDMEHLPPWVYSTLRRKFRHLRRKGNIDTCPYCGSRNIIKFGKVEGVQRYRCRDCGKTFLENAYHRIIAHRKMHEQLKDELLMARSFSIIEQISDILPGINPGMAMVIHPMKRISIHGLLRIVQDKIGARINRNIFYRTVKGLYLLGDFLECLKGRMTVRYIRIKDVKQIPRKKLNRVRVEMIVEEGKKEIEAALEECLESSGKENTAEEGESVLPLLEITSIKDGETYLYPDESSEKS